MLENLVIDRLQGRASSELTKIKIETEPESTATVKAKTNQISVDLDQIFNPNPKLVKTYEDAKATGLYAFDRDNKAEFLNEARVFSAARASRKPIKHNIFSLYRKQIGSQGLFLRFNDRI